MRLNVETSGNGSPLVLLHGFTGSNQTWDELDSRLVATHQLIKIEMLGHGKSPAPNEVDLYSASHAILDIAAVLDELGIKQTALLGYSMGGRIALHFALAYPTRLSQLILESATAGIEDEAARQNRRESDNRLADQIEQDGLEKFVAYWESLALFATIPPDQQAQLHQKRLTNRPHGLANSLRGIGTGQQASLWPNLKDLSVRTLLVAGELDLKFSQIAHAMKAVLPNANLAIVKKAGHTVHLEQAELFAKLVLDFLKEQNGD